MRSDSKGPAGLRIVSAYGERRWVGPTPNRRAYGVPPGGPFDRFSAALARALVGLPSNAPVLEIALGPVAFEAVEPVVVAVVGGPDGVFPLAPGARLEARPVGARAYVATLPTPAARRSRRLADPPRLGEAPFRVVAGPQADLLDFDAFLAGTYVVGLVSNRVGVRLEGSARPHGLSLPSEPAIPGAIQVPPNGQPIVLGPDGPTIGGYPKIAVVIDADLDRLGRARPGDGMRFEAISIAAAREARRRADEAAARRIAELKLGLGVG